MIELTRLNGHRLVLNCDLIKYAEATPDTTLTLVNGEKLIVSETPELLLERITAFRSRVLAQAWPDAAQAFAARSIISLPAKEAPSWT